MTIPVFGLHHEALHYTVKNDSDCLETLMSVIENCQAIHGLEETNKTKELGKWLFITDAENLSDARKFID